MILVDSGEIAPEECRNPLLFWGDCFAALSMTINKFSRSRFCVIARRFGPKQSPPTGWRFFTSFRMTNREELKLDLQQKHNDLFWTQLQISTKQTPRRNIGKTSCQLPTQFTTRAIRIYSGRTRRGYVNSIASERDV